MESWNLGNLTLSEFITKEEESVFKPESFFKKTSKLHAWLVEGSIPGGSTISIQSLNIYNYSRVKPVV